MVVNGKIVDDRFHRKRQRVLEVLFGGLHRGLQPFLRGVLHCGVKQESHPASRHAPQHPESPELLAELRSCHLYKRLGKQIVAPGNDCLQGAKEVACRDSSDCPHVTLMKCLHDFIQDGDGLLPSLPLRIAAQQILLGNHLQNRSTFWAMPP